MLDNIVMQMRKINREKGYSGQNGYDNILSIYIFTTTVSNLAIWLANFP